MQSEKLNLGVTKRYACCHLGDGNIVISDCSSGQTVGELKGHAGHIMSVYAAGDGIIASGSADNTVRLWDLRSQRCIDVVATGDSCVASVCINTPGNLLASGTVSYFHM